MLHIVVDDLLPEKAKNLFYFLKMRLFHFSSRRFILWETKVNLSFFSFQLFKVEDLPRESKKFSFFKKKLSHFFCPFFHLISSFFCVSTFEFRFGKNGRWGWQSQG